MIDGLRETLPAYAQDLGLSLAALDAETTLDDQQKWGACVAAAHAAGVGPVLKAVEAGARAAGVSDEAINAAKAASAIMAMSNVYFRALHLLSNAEYRSLPSRLRMNVAANPEVRKADFELWCLTVSAINGCGACLDSHEAELRRRGVSHVQVQAALRIGAVVHAIARVAAVEQG